MSVTENDAAALIDSNITLTDSDSTDFNSGQLTLSYTSGGGAQNQLTVLSAGNISFDGTNVSYSGVGTIATINGANNGANGASLIFDLTANANATRIRELIESITYQNTSETPAASRTLGITVTDGDGGTSATQSVVISVTSVNDVPTLDNPISDQSASAGQQSSFTLPPTLSAISMATPSPILSRSQTTALQLG